MQCCAVSRGQQKKTSTASFFKGNPEPPPQKATTTTTTTTKQKNKKTQKTTKKIKQNNNQVPEALQENSWIPDAKKVGIQWTNEKNATPPKTKMKPYLVGGFNPSQKY